MEVLHSFVWNHVKYANMEGFCRQSQLLLLIQYHGCTCISILYRIQLLVKLLNYAKFMLATKLLRIVVLLP